MDVRRRWIHVVAVIGLCFVALELRLFHLQILKHPRAEQKVDDVRQKTENLVAQRGSILDRNGRALAITLPAIEVYADSRWNAKPQTRDRLATLFSEYGLGEVRQIRADLERTGYRKLFAKPISDAEIVVELAQLHRDGQLPGIDLHATSVRSYPENRLAAAVIGYVDAEGKGATGIELALDAELTGRAGKRTYEKDAGRNAMIDVGHIVAAATPGNDVSLTLDVNMQWFVEEEIDALIEKFKPRWVCAIVTRPATGEVLALVNRPTFDPNQYGNYAPEAFRNNAVTLTYAPGSAFKPFMMALALDRNKVTPNTPIDCENGSWNTGSRSIRDVHKEGILTASEVIQHSSNVGMVKVVHRLVPPDDAPKEERMKSYRAVRRWLDDLGFGKETGIGLPGESKGRFTNMERWTRQYTLTSLAMGYEIQTTPMQVVAAFDAFANGGRWIAPRIVRDVRNARGVVLAEPYQPERVVFDDEVAVALRSMMAQVVEEGTAKPAQLDGWSMAGKTSTAQYERDRSKYTSSFIAMAPVHSPELVVSVVVDQPKGAHFGATVAAPTVKGIMERCLTYLRVPQDRPSTEEVDAAPVSGR
ncbi:MAG: penicillin-binding protein 2 [Planctomycetes bacterium]|nr:penicillin-binding protein 2 [Planctomycetota bacterium]MCC7170092.1 penicillin-binding protein 2 [Planctomycetota bacterium]